MLLLIFSEHAISTQYLNIGGGSTWKVKSSICMLYTPIDKYWVWLFFL